MTIHLRRATPVLALTLLAGVARADTTADALLKVLVRKGVLTQEEAAAVKAEAEQEAAKPAPAPKEAPKAAAPKVTVGGFLQARVVSQRYANPSTQFSDRRARIVARSVSDTGRLALSIDGAPSGASLRDAYYEWYITPAVKKVQGYNIKFGQFFKPFGLENEYYELDKEFPENPVGIPTLFAGQRDVGVDFSKGLDANTRVNFAVLNGNGAGLITLTNKDNDNYKDLLLRVSHTVPKVGTFAVSGYRGKNTIAAVAPTAAVTGFADENGNGSRDPGEPVVIISPAKPGVPAFTGDRNRLGLAAILNNVAGGQVRTEFIAAKEIAANLGAGAAYGNADARAWFAQYTHPVTKKDSVALRYDSYDPDIHNRYRLDGDGEVKTFGVAGVHNVNEALRLTLAWERPRVTRYSTATKSGDSRNEDSLTIQGQYRF